VAHTEKDKPFRLWYVDIPGIDPRTGEVVPDWDSKCLRKPRKKKGGLRFRKRPGDAWEYEERRYTGKTEVPGLRTREKRVWKKEVLISLS
jgi:hypothetical protein